MSSQSARRAARCTTRFRSRRGAVWATDSDGLGFTSAISSRATKCAAGITGRRSTRARPRGSRAGRADTFQQRWEHSAADGRHVESALLSASISFPSGRRPARWSTVPDSNDDRPHHGEGGSRSRAERLTRPRRVRDVPNRLHIPDGRGPRPSRAPSTPLAPFAGPRRQPDHRETRRRSPLTGTGHHWRASHKDSASLGPGRAFQATTPLRLLTHAKPDVAATTSFPRDMTVLLDTFDPWIAILSFGQTSGCNLSRPWTEGSLRGLAFFQQGSAPTGGLVTATHPVVRELPQTASRASTQAGRRCRARLAEALKPKDESRAAGWL